MKRQLLKVDTLKNLTLDMHQGINTVTENVVYLEKGIPILQSKHITKGYLNLDDTKYLSEKDYLKYKDKYQANVDDVLVCNIGTIGKSLRILKADKFLIAWNLFLIKLDKTKLYSQYFAHYLNHLSDKNYFDKFLTGGTVKFINKKTMGNIEVPLPPLETQQKIASILDAADTLRQKDKALLAKYDELTQALFLDMFGDPVSNPKVWEKVKLGDLCGVGSSKRVFVDELVDSGIPFYRGTEVGKLGEGKEIIPTLFITEEHYQKLKKERGIPKKGDLLMPSICPDGRIWVIDNDSKFYFKDGRVLWIEVDGNKMNSSYLKYHLKGSFFANYNNIASGTTFAELKIVALKKLNVLYPDIKLQNQYAERITIIEQQKAQAQASLEKSEELFNSLLQKAFNGELV